MVLRGKGDPSAYIVFPPSGLVYIICLSVIFNRNVKFSRQESMLNCLYKLFVSFVPHFKDFL